MRPETETLLNHQETCPKCSADWINLAEMLLAPLGEDDRETALAMIKNCDYCGIKFRRFLDGY